MSGDGLPSTIIYPNAFLRSPSAGFDGVYNWDHWVEVFKKYRNIRPGDIDCLVEISGFFLMCESKDEGISLRENDGSGRMRRALLNTGLVTFIYQWGKREPVAWQWENMRLKSPVYDSPTTRQSIIEEIKHFMDKWARIRLSLDTQRIWRRRLIDAALNGAPADIEIELFEELRRKTRDRLGDFVDTPLGQAAVE